MRKIAKWVAAIGTAGAVILLGWHLVTYLSIRRTNAANMARAENVKRAFDVANPAGTSADVVK